jgi:mRNA interferase MazF
MQRLADPARGEIWVGHLDPVRGHEQGGSRPVLIVSHDIYNQGPATLIVVVPLTTTGRNVRWQVPIDPPEGGVRRPSHILCDAVRSIAKERLAERWGKVSPVTMAAVEHRLRILLSL